MKTLGPILASCNASACQNTSACSNASACQNASSCSSAPASCSNASSCSRPASSSSCAQAQSCPPKVDRSRQLLNAYDSEDQKKPKPSRKCAQVVKEQLQKEATFLVKHFYVNALEEVNRALCFAPNDSESLGLLYANRAHILGEMELYAEALKSINLALQNNFPSCHLCELKETQDNYSKKVCEMGAKTATPHKFRMALSYPSCPRNPHIIKDIHVEQNKQYGRHLITDRDLEVGDVICLEDPYIICIQPEQRYMRCTNCLSEAPHLLVPCTGCTNAMFCSVTCQEDAWDSFHQYECSISEDLMSLEPDVGRLALRTFLLAVKLFGNDITELQNFLKENQCRKITTFDLDHSRLCKKDQFLAYYNGNCNDAHLSSCVKAANIVKSARLTSLLANQCAFAAQLQCDKLKVFLMELLYHMTCVNTNNCYEVGSPSMDHSKVPTGLGLFLCMSMASHSCSGNVTRLRVDGVKQMWVVTHFIPQGSQIFDNYGAFFMNQCLGERQKRLMDHYGFKCECEACLFDFPLAKNLNEPPSVPWPGVTYITASSPVTVAKLKAELGSIKDFITKYECEFPCQQLRTAEMRLVNLFRVATRDDNMETKYPEFTTHTPYLELMDEVDSCELKRELESLC